jgi:DNA repair protein RAD5
MDFLTICTVSLDGHVIDCPQSLTTGCTILLNVKVYLAPKAFVAVTKVGREENGTFWQEQKETIEEEAMRKRKDALGALFSESLLIPQILIITQAELGSSLYGATPSCLHRRKTAVRRSTRLR